MADQTAETPPTAEDEMSKFTGFTAKDGEVVAAPKSKAVEATAEPDASAEDDTGDDNTDDAVDEQASTDAVAAPEDEEDLKPKGKKWHKKTAAERIEAIRRETSKLRQAERDLQALQERMVESSNRVLTKDRDDTKKDSSDRPKPEDFEFGEVDSRYIAALVSHETKQALRAERERSDTERRQQAEERKAAESNERLKEFLDAGSEKFDDFDEVVLDSARNGEWPMSDTIGELAVASDHGYDVLYHLATNPKEARQVYGKSPLEQAAYFGRLEAKFSASSAAKPDKGVKTSKAPPPVKTARGANGKFQASPDTTDFKAFEALAMGTGPQP